MSVICQNYRIQTPKPENIIWIILGIAFGITFGALLFGLGGAFIGGVIGGLIFLSKQSLED